MIIYYMIITILIFFVTLCFLFLYSFVFTFSPCHIKHRIHRENPMSFTKSTSWSPTPILSPSFHKQFILIRMESTIVGPYSFNLSELRAEVTKLQSYDIIPVYVPGEHYSF